MSFGVSLGDVLLCSKLALSAYSSLKDAPKEFEGLRLEVLSLNATLRALAEEADSPNSIILLASPQRQESLKVLLSNCSKGLEQLQQLTRKFPSLASNDKTKFLEHVRFSLQNKNGPRDKLAIHTASINIFLTSLTHSSLGRLEGLIKNALRGSYRQQQNVQTQFSIPSSGPAGFGAFGSKSLGISPDKLSSHSEKKNSTWQTIEQELSWEGIDVTKVDEFKDEIVAYVRHLCRGGEPYYRRGVPDEHLRRSREDDVRHGNSDFDSYHSHGQHQQMHERLERIHEQPPPAYSQRQAAAQQQAQGHQIAIQQEASRRNRVKFSKGRRRRTGQVEQSSTQQHDRPTGTQSSQGLRPQNTPASSGATQETTAQTWSLESVEDTDDDSDDGLFAIPERRPKPATDETARPALSLPFQIPKETHSAQVEEHQPTPANPYLPADTDPNFPWKNFTGSNQSSTQQASSNTQPASRPFGSATNVSGFGQGSNAGFRPSPSAFGGPSNNQPSSLFGNPQASQIGAQQNAPTPAVTIGLFGNVGSNPSKPTSLFSGTTQGPESGDNADADDLAIMFDHIFDVDEAVPAMTQGVEPSESVSVHEALMSNPLSHRADVPGLSVADLERLEAPILAELPSVSEVHDTNSRLQKPKLASDHVSRSNATQVQRLVSSIVGPAPPPLAPGTSNSLRYARLYTIQTQLITLCSHVYLAQQSQDDETLQALLFDDPKTGHVSPVQSRVNYLRDEGAGVISCDLCTAPIPDVHWHCDQCADGDWDCCFTCKMQDKKCPGDHDLMERSAKSWGGTSYWSNLTAPPPP